MKATVVQAPNCRRKRGNGDGEVVRVDSQASCSRRCRKLAEGRRGEAAGLLAWAAAGSQPARRPPGTGAQVPERCRRRARPGPLGHTLQATGSCVPPKARFSEGQRPAAVCAEEEAWPPQSWALADGAQPAQKHHGGLHASDNCNVRQATPVTLPGRPSPVNPLQTYS